MASRNTAIIEVSTDQDREPRLRVTLDGKFRRLSDELHPLITLNVSENGMLFVAGEQLQVGVLIDLKLPLPGTGREIALVGRVTRVRGLGGGKFEAAIRFVHIAGVDRRLLVQHAERAGTT
jgi:hypothetical protein